MLLICQSDSRNCSQVFNITTWLHPTQGRCWTLVPHRRYPSSAAQASLKLFVFNEDPFWYPDLRRLPPLARTDEILLITHPAGEYPDVSSAPTLVTSTEMSVTQHIHMTQTIYPTYHSSILCVPKLQRQPIRVLVGPLRQLREFAYSRELCQTVSYGPSLL